jgi:hypothetical protein
MTTPPYPNPPATPEPQYTLGHLMPDPTAASTPAPTARSMPAAQVAAWITLGAGVAIVLASFMPWGSITAPIVGTRTVSGTEGSDGWITAGVGVFIAVFAGLRLRRQLSGTAGAAVGALAALGGLGVAGVAVWKIVDLQSKIAELKAEMTRESDEFGIAAAMADAVQAQPGVGLYLLIAAGVVTAVTATYVALARSS